LRLARALNEHGYATYRYDDRGTGYSRDSTPAKTLGSIAADAANALAVVANAPRIDPSRVIILGHGEGGLIAPMLLTQNPGPAGLILVNAPVGTGIDLLTEQAEQQMRAAGNPESKIDAKTSYYRDFLGAVIAGANDDDLANLSGLTFNSSGAMMAPGHFLQLTKQSDKTWPIWPTRG